MTSLVRWMVLRERSDVSGKVARLEREVKDSQATLDGRRGELRELDEWLAANGGVPETSADLAAELYGAAVN